MCQKSNLSILYKNCDPLTKLSVIDNKNLVQLKNYLMTF